jgi:hypothetical protein
MRKSLIAICAGLIVVVSTQAYAGNALGGKCYKVCEADYKSCKERAGGNRNVVALCRTHRSVCQNKC